MKPSLLTKSVLERRLRAALKSRQDDLDSIGWRKLILEVQRVGVDAYARGFNTAKSGGKK